MAVISRKNFRRELLVSFGIILGIAIVGWFGLSYFSGDLAGQSAKIVADKSYIAEQTAVLGTLAKLKNDAAQTAPYLAALQKLLPTHDALIGFPQWVSTVAAAHNVTADASFTGQNTPASAATPGSDGFSLKASGSAADLAAFLDDLESQSPGFIIAADSFDLSENNGQYTLSVQGRVFSRGAST